MNLTRLATKASLALTTAVAFTAIGATAASAGVHVLPDFNDDVIEDWALSDYYETGDYDMDLSSLRIDHQSQNVVLTHTFDSFSTTSLHGVLVQFDTNADGQIDHTAIWDHETKTGTVRYGALENDGATRCSSFASTLRLGSPGTLTFTIPRSCLGNPAQVAVRTDIVWFGTDNEGNDLSYFESAPGTILEDFLTLSPAVAAQRAVTVRPGPVVVAPKPVATSLTVAKRKPGKSAVKVRVKATRTPQGKLSMRIAGKTVKANVRSAKQVSLKLPRGTRKGTYKATITFTPSNRSLLKASRKVVKVKVR